MGGEHERYLTALVLKDGGVEQVVLSEISGMGEVFFEDVREDARTSAYECIEEWPEGANFARVRLSNFERFEGQPSPFEGMPKWSIQPHYEMERTILEFGAVEPDEQGRPRETIIEKP